MNNPISKHTDYHDFPVGTKVRIVSKVVDFCFFYGETGIVTRNSGQYLGIVVRFDEVRNFSDGTKQLDFNFCPQNLELINNMTLTQYNTFSQLQETEFFE